MLSSVVQTGMNLTIDKWLRIFLLKGGIYVLTLMDAYSGSYSLLFVCFCEVVGIAWFYGQWLHKIWQLMINENCLGVIQIQIDLQADILNFIEEYNNIHFIH